LYNRVFSCQKQADKPLCICTISVSKCTNLPDILFKNTPKLTPIHTLTQRP
jgi:hypothetical protein